MFNRKSSYALNKKDPNAIVYMDANEAIIRLTREDFASEEEFLKWKSLSDADYHASEKEDHVYANHTLALDELSEEAASIPAADVCMEQAHDRVAEIRRSTQKVTQIRKHLTDTQFRRMWMYFVDPFFSCKRPATIGISPFLSCCVFGSVQRYQQSRRKAIHRIAQEPSCTLGAN